MGREAGEKALADAGIDYSDIESAFIGYCYGDSTSGQRRCTSSASPGSRRQRQQQLLDRQLGALPRPALRPGAAWPTACWPSVSRRYQGSLKGNFEDRTNPMDKHFTDMVQRRGF